MHRPKSASYGISAYYRSVGKIREILVKSMHIGQDQEGKYEVLFGIGI